MGGSKICDSLWQGEGGVKNHQKKAWQTLWTAPWCCRRRSNLWTRVKNMMLAVWKPIHDFLSNFYWVFLSISYCFWDIWHPSFQGLLPTLSTHICPDISGITLSFVDIHLPAPAPILRNFTIPYHSITHISHPQCTSFTCSLEHLRHNPCWASWLVLLHLTICYLHFQCWNLSLGPHTGLTSVRPFLSSFDIPS